jgi:radical SAM superfamily enzyme YgiQ (UPF0313 family)
MKLLLVQPPLTLSPEVHPPLGLCVLAAHLQHAGHTVRILDLDLEEKVAPQGDPNRYLVTVAESLRRERPAVVGVTSMFNNSLQAERIIGAAKEFDPTIVTVAGGSHFGALPRESLARIGALDFVVRGEGEATLAALLAAIEAGDATEAIAGLCLRADGGIRENAPGPLIELPGVAPVWPALKDVIEIGRYAATSAPESPRRAVYIEAGRGCPFACTFCATAPFWQRRYRVKSVASIVAEIRFLHSAFGYDTFMLVHDLLTVDKRFMHEFCDAMFAAELPVEWTANHRADLPLGELAPKMRSAGCLSVFMGIETASNRLQDEVEKGLTREQIVSTVSTLRDVGISSTCSFIVGFPSETRAELSATLGLAAELKLIGAEPVQVHRLRRWPPAELAYRDLPSSFDREALQLEYPSHTIPDADVATIAADPNFFMGYFTPETLAGSAYQLAQIELFFAHMLAVLPITAAVLAALYRDSLVDAFCRALDLVGALQRESMGSAPDVCSAVVPFLERWIAADAGLAAWQSKLLSGALSYERVRVAFMAEAEPVIAPVLSDGANWSAFAVTIDVVALLRQLAAGANLDPMLCQAGYIALSRRADGAVRGYALTDSGLERLRRNDSDLATALQSR